MTDSVENECVAVAAASFGLSDVSVHQRQCGNTNKLFRVMYKSRVDSSVSEAFLRLSSPSRSLEQVLSEVSWMDHLFKSGIKVSRPLRSLDGQLAVPIIEKHCDRESTIVAIVTATVSGSPAILDKYRHLNNLSVLSEWAKLIASMHQHAIANRHLGIGRQHWYDDVVLKKALSDISPLTKSFRGHLEESTKALRNATMHDIDYGLTHADCQMTNIFINRIDDQKLDLYLIDFDDCCFHYFGHDVAVAIVQIRKMMILYPDIFPLTSNQQSNVSIAEQHFLDQYCQFRFDSDGIIDNFEMKSARDRLFSLLPLLIIYRASLIICYMSYELTSSNDDNTEMNLYLKQSLPIYYKMISND